LAFNKTKSTHYLKNQAANFQFLSVMEGKKGFTNILELFEALKAAGFKSCFDGLVEYKGEVGFTFNLRDCIREDKYTGLPDFDSGFTMSQDQKKKLDMLVGRYVNDQIRKKRQTVAVMRRSEDNKKKFKGAVKGSLGKIVVENIETNVDGGRYYSYPFDLFADVYSFLLTEKLEWKPISQLSSYCCRCLGKLKECIIIGEYELYLSRPDFHPEDSTDEVKGDYSTFNNSYDTVRHAVHWANGHGLDKNLNFMDFDNYFPGFRHLYQQYNHVHNHYIQDIEFNDTGFFDKGLTNSIGQYITACFIENFTKLHKVKQVNKVYIRGLTGCFPFDRVYNSFVNNVDKHIYECLCIQIIFGLYGNFKRSRAGFMEYFESLSQVVRLVNSELMTAIITGPLIIPNFAEEWYEKYHKEYITKFPHKIVILDFVDQQELDEEIQAFLNEIYT